MGDMALTCVNCAVTLTEEEAIKEVFLSLDDDDSSDGADWRPEEDSGQGLLLRDTLSSIFGTILLSGSKTGELNMCYRCAEAMSTLYQAFLDFINLSTIDSSICDMISQIKGWHQQKSSVGVDESIQNGSHFLNSNGDESAVNCESDLEAQESTEKNSYESWDGGNGCKKNRRRSLRVSFSRTALSSTDKKSTESYDLGNSTTNSGNEALEDDNSLFPLVQIAGDEQNRAESGSGADGDVTLRKRRGRGRPRKSETKFSSQLKHKKLKSKMVLDSNGDPFRSEKRSRIRNRNPHQRAPCALCERKFPFFWMVNFHVLKIHENKVPKKCKSCKFEYFEEEREQSHKCFPATKDSHQLTRCGYCGERLLKSRLLKHGYRHERQDLGTFDCQEPGCGRSFLYQPCLLNHVEKCHTETGLERKKERTRRQCEECGKVLHDQRSLADHMDTHAAESKFLCTICGMAFKQDRALRRHTHMTHFAARQYQCPLCHLGFKTGYHLRKHFRCKVHHPEEVAELLKKKAGDFKTTGQVLIPTKNKFKNHSLWARKKRKGSGHVALDDTGSHEHEIDRRADREVPMERLTPEHIQPPVQPIPNFYQFPPRFQEYSVPSFYEPLLR